MDNNKMIRSLILVSLFIHTTLASIASPEKWSTLSGQPPLVIARGGLTGVFPEATKLAIEMAMATGLPDLVILCNLQMTKDGVPLCLTDIKLDNATNVANFDPNGAKTYNIHGKDVTAHFTVDYTNEQLLQNVHYLNQAIYSRPSVYDGLNPIATLDDIITAQPAKLWLNIQYDSFYEERGIKMQEYVLNKLKATRIDFISSPEIGFLKSINGKVNKLTTKVIFQLLDEEEVEPTTKQPYGTIAKDLATIKSFASGIMVPKEYIQPVKPDKYLGLPTTLVADAHILGLEVYAYGFTNDGFTSFNYSYDPVAEYLRFLDLNGSVDGFVTDFSSTASETVACFAQNSTRPIKGQALIISHNGASGVYPGCSDLAYHQAINDGANIIDCSVQMTKDKVVFCSDSISLVRTTTAVSKFLSRSSKIPQIQNKDGIFSFDLTWSEIHSLKPQIASPFENGYEKDFKRDPAHRNSGKFFTFSEFLELAKARAVTGILINIENAPYLASTKGLDIVDAVRTALSNSSLDKQSKQEVLIQSDDTWVLSRFQDIPSYKKVFLMDKKIGIAPKQSIEEIKKYATAVNLPKGSIITTSDSFTTGMTNIVQEMKNANLTVFVHVLKNEFVSLAFDYFADPYVEIATYIKYAGVDGIVTEFPATASRYMRSHCSDTEAPDNVYTIQPAKPGELLTTLAPESRPPAEAPLPPLEIENTAPKVVASATTTSKPGGL